MTSFPDAPVVVNELFYGEKEGAVPGVTAECVLKAAILELRCAKCDVQERWRGRSDRAVGKVARLRGWKFRNGHALCPQHASRKDRKNILGVCSYRKCKDAIFVVPKMPGARGRPTNKCRKHYLMLKKWSANRDAKRLVCAT